MSVLDARRAFPLAGDLEQSWHAASEDHPIVIVGAGRWGRAWVSALTAARGGGAGLTVVSKRRDEVAGWLGDVAPGARVELTIEAAFDAPRRPQLAIIASRPRDHMVDAMQAIDADSSVLVEKPLSDVPSDTAVLLEAAQSKRLLVGLGTEFAFHPAFQIARARLGGAAIETAELEWTDPVAEIRHGQRKSLHEEIGVLEDVLPHAVSIFRAIDPTLKFRLSSEETTSTATGGVIVLRDQYSSRNFVVSCDRAATVRRRRLSLRSSLGIVEIDFGSDPAKVSIGGREIVWPVELALFTSTLRLEIGAFILRVSGRLSESPITSGIEELAALQGELRQMNKAYNG